MNWGYKITLVFVGFVGFILYMVISTFQYDVNLVAKDYYKKEMAYDQEIQKIKNTKSLKQPLEITYNAQQQALHVQFPHKKINGEIWFFRPSSYRQDTKVEASTDQTGLQIVPVKDLQKGLWNIKIDWQANGKGYYQEKKMMVYSDKLIKIRN